MKTVHDTPARVSRFIEHNAHRNRTSTRRRYEKRARAAQEQATRLRIVEAAIALHGTIGPARTTVSAIAERAGVRRATVYRHFPDERALFLGCSGTFRERNPPPDPATWAAIPDPAARLEAALDAVYGWYERVEPMFTALMRDAGAMPIVAELLAGRREYLRAIEDGLAPAGARAGRRPGGCARRSASRSTSSPGDPSTSAG